MSNSKQDESVIDRELLSYRLNEILADRGMSLADVKRASVVDNSILSKYLKGYKTPSLYNLLRIAAALDVSLDYLVGQEGKVKTLASEIKNIAVLQKGAGAREIEEKAEEILHMYSGSRK